MQFDETLTERKGRIRIPADLSQTSAGKRMILFIQANMLILDMRFNPHDDTIEYVGQSMWFDPYAYRIGQPVPRYAVATDYQAAGRPEASSFWFERVSEPFRCQEPRPIGYSELLDEIVTVSEN